MAQGAADPTISGNRFGSGSGLSFFAFLFSILILYTFFCNNTFFSNVDMQVKSTHDPTLFPVTVKLV